MAEGTKTKWWHVWVTFRSDSGDKVNVATHKLLCRGFIVGPIGRQLVTAHDDGPAAVLAMMLYRSPKDEEERKDYNAAGIRAEVVDALKLAKVISFSIVVAEEAIGVTWALGSASIADDEKAVEAVKQKLN